MAVRIRLKKMGRTHRPFFRICAMDQRAPRDGRVIEELGTYDPMVGETDARVTLKSERVDYWLSVGAKPTQKAGVLIRKYGTNGTHLQQQEEARGRLSSKKQNAIAAATAYKPPAPKPPEPEPAAEAPADEATEGATAEGETTEETSSDES